MAQKDAFLAQTDFSQNLIYDSTLYNNAVFSLNERNGIFYNFFYNIHVLRFSFLCRCICDKGIPFVTSTLFANKSELNIYIMLTSSICQKYRCKQNGIDSLYTT